MPVKVRFNLRALIHVAQQLNDSSLTMEIELNNFIILFKIQIRHVTPVCQRFRKRMPLAAAPRRNLQ